MLQPSDIDLYQQIKQAVRAHLTLTTPKLAHLIDLASLNAYFEKWDTQVTHDVLWGGAVANSQVNSLDIIAGLVVYSYRACGGASDRIIDLAASTHLIFSAAGIFDDIQDQDKPYSLPATLGVGRALNVGLLLLLAGQNLLSKTLAEIEITSSPFKAADITTSNSPKSTLDSRTLPNIFNEYLLRGIRGQLADLQDLEIPLELRLQPETSKYYADKNKLKSALMFSYLAQLGSFAAFGQNNPTVELYQRFGLIFGMTVQLIADLGDFLLLEDSRDLANQQITLPILYAAQKLNEKEKLKVISLLNEKPVKVSEVVKILDTKAGSHRTIEQIGLQILQAEETLKVLDPQLNQPEHRLMIKALQDFALPLQQVFFDLIKSYT